MIKPSISMAPSVSLQPSLQPSVALRPSVSSNPSQIPTMVGQNCMSGNVRLRLQSDTGSNLIEVKDLKVGDTMKDLVD